MTHEELCKLTSDLPVEAWAPRPTTVESWITWCMHYLIGEGYHSWEWGYDSDRDVVWFDAGTHTEPCELTPQSGGHYDDTLRLLVMAVRDVAYHAREGEAPAPGEPS